MWDGPERTRLNAVVALQRPVAPFGVADVWRSDQAPLAALLVDRETAGRALESMTDWLARNWPGTVGLGLANVDVGGALAQAFRDLSVRRSLRLEISNPRRRAALACGAGAGFETLIAARRRKEWGRLKRRLMDCGRLDFDWSDGPGAVEDFLRLEAAGWKGAQGTALAADPKRAAFARETLGGFAARGRLQIAQPLARRSSDRGGSRVALRRPRLLLEDGIRSGLCAVLAGRAADPCDVASSLRPTAASSSPILARTRTIR